MTVGDFLKDFTKFAEETPDSLVNFYRWCEAAYEGTYYYIKSIRADDGCVYLECDGGEASDICGDYRYFDALVLVHFLRKIDPSFELRLCETASFGGYYGNHETVIDINVDLTDENCLEYDGSDDICISLPEDLNEDENEDDEEWDDEDDEDDEDE